jgi:hypothetical protein
MRVGSKAWREEASASERGGAGIDRIAPGGVERCARYVRRASLPAILDGLQYLHNLGAYTVMVPKDRAVGLTRTAIKVVSGWRRSRHSMAKLSFSHIS